MSEERYQFRPARLDDLPMLRRWLAEPHVRDWWGQDDPFDAEELAEPRVARRIVIQGGKPIAYMQDYAVHGWDGGHHFDGLPAGSRGIDLFVGPPEILGQGDAVRFVRVRIEQLFAAGAPMIAADPHPDNARSIAFFGKLGFGVTGPEQETEWGRILPMVLPKVAVRA